MQIQTEYYQNILAAFKDYLRVMGYRKSSLSGIKEFFAKLEEHGFLTLDQIKSLHIKKHYLYLQNRSTTRGELLSPHTITGHLYEIKSLLRWAEKTKRIRISPMAGMRFATPAPTQRAILSKAEIKQLYAVCELPQQRLTLSLYYGCGLRASEGGALNLKDIHLQSGLLYVRKGKGKKRRVIPITSGIVEDIKNYIHLQRPGQISWRTKEEDKQALALNKIGTRMQAQSYRIVFKTILRKLENEEIENRGVSLHSLRHSIATHLLADGMNMERVRDFLGHNHLETTQIYTRINISQL